MSGQSSLRGFWPAKSRMSSSCVDSLRLKIRRDVSGSSGGDCCLVSEFVYMYCCYVCRSKEDIRILWEKEEILRCLLHAGLRNLSLDPVGTDAKSSADVPPILRSAHCYPAHNFAQARSRDLLDSLVIDSGMACTNHTFHPFVSLDLAGTFCNLK